MKKRKADFTAYLQFPDRKDFMLMERKIYAAYKSLKKRMKQNRSAICKVEICGLAKAYRAKNFSCIKTLKYWRKKKVTHFDDLDIVFIEVII